MAQLILQGFFEQRCKLTEFPLETIKEQRQHYPTSVQLLATCNSRCISITFAVVASTSCIKGTLKADTRPTQCKHVAS